MLPQVGDVKPLGLTKVSKTLAALIAKQGPKATAIIFSILAVAQTQKSANCILQTKHARALVPTETVQLIARDGMRLDALLLRPKRG